MCRPLPSWCGRSGTRFVIAHRHACCADNWLRNNTPAATWPLAQFASLGTEVTYFRIETGRYADLRSDAKAAAYVGVITQRCGWEWLGQDLTVSGKPVRGVIRYDPSWGRRGRCIVELDNPFEPKVLPCSGINRYLARPNGPVQAEPAVGIEPTTNGLQNRSTI